MSLDGRAAGQLIGYGLDTKLAPARNAAYRELVARFQNDADFRLLVESICEGQGLVVLECSTIFGLVLAPHDTPETPSPFHMRLDDYAAMKPEERHLNALFFLAIAAAAYPTADSLDIDGGPLPQLTVADVVRVVNRVAARVRDSRIDRDPPANEPMLEPIYRLVSRWRDGDTTPDERSNPHVKTGMVRRALKFLATTGMADELTTTKDAFRIRSRFRLHVKDAVGTIGPALARVRELAAPSSGEAA